MRLRSLCGVSRRTAFVAGVCIVLILIGLLALSGAFPRGVSGEDATFGGVSLRLELATTTAAQERGLGGRAVIPDHYGMLFVFSQSDRYGFWMKDMRVPIDIFWLDDKGQVITIASRVAPESYPGVFYPTTAARYVLETRAGFAEDYRIATGTPLDLKNPALVSR